MSFDPNKSWDDVSRRLNKLIEQSPHLLVKNRVRRFTKPHIPPVLEEWEKGQAENEQAVAATAGS